MTFDDQSIAAARKLDRHATQRILEESAPTVLRLAWALSGRRDVADGVLRYILKRALIVMPNWRDADMAHHWFYHHTVLTVRRTLGHTADAIADPLLGNNPSPDRIAFVRAFRNLPVQQREAFLLQHAEQLQPRDLARAMDCSIQAAGVHLHGAEIALKPLAGESFIILQGQIAMAYRQITPSSDDLIPLAHQTISAMAWRRRLRWCALGLVVAALLVAGWFIYPHVRRLISSQ